MRLRWGDLLFLVLVAGIGALWYFGRTQRLVVVERTPMVSCPDCQGRGVLNCPKCGEFGRLESFLQCPVCKGTGKHGWRLCSHLGAPCRHCRGTGSVEGRCDCGHCRSTGKVKCERCAGVGRIASSPALRIRTVRAEPSPWERFLMLIGLGPGPNPKPYQDGNGECPLLRKYIELKSGPRVAVLDWGKFRWDGPEWKIITFLEREDTLGRKTQRSVEFIVRDREVAGSRPAAAARR